LPVVVFLVDRQRVAPAGKRVDRVRLNAPAAMSARCTMPFRNLLAFGTPSDDIRFVVIKRT
jgi:hypothetical protein